MDLVAQRWAGAHFSAQRLRVEVERALADAANGFDAGGGDFLVYALTVLQRHLKRLERE